jgi:hypothetical protein
VPLRRNWCLAIASREGQTAWRSCQAWIDLRCAGVSNVCAECGVGRWTTDDEL